MLEVLNAVTKKLNLIKNINIGGKPASCKIKALKSHPSLK